MDKLGGNSIGIFGGSFDPPHKGHAHIISEFWRYFPTAQKLYIVPNKISPLKVSKAVGSEEIVGMLEIQIQSIGAVNTEVSRIEIDREGPSYTIDTIRYFRKLHPDKEILLLMGMDSIASLPKWKDYLSILDLSNIVVFRRSGENRIEKFIDSSPKITYIDNSLVDVSSTELRQALQARQKSDGILEKVYDYIVEKGLYQ